MKKWALLTGALGLLVAGTAHADYNPSYWHSNQNSQAKTESQAVQTPPAQPTTSPSSGAGQTETSPSSGSSETTTSSSSTSSSLTTPSSASETEASAVGSPSAASSSPAMTSNGYSSDVPSNGGSSTATQSSESSVEGQSVSVTQIYPLNTDTAVMQIFYDQLSPSAKQDWAQLPPQWREVAVQLAQEDLDHGSFYNIDDPDRYVQQALEQYQATLIQPEM